LLFAIAESDSGDDEDEDDDSEEEGEDDTEMPASKKDKKATPKKDGVDGVTEGVSTMAVGIFSSFSMDMKLPFMVKHFLDNNQKACQVDVLVPTTQVGDINVLNVTGIGNYLEVGVAVPSVFWTEDCVLRANQHRAGVNQSSHVCTAHEE
jgi:hypothetical protein